MPSISEREEFYAFVDELLKLTSGQTIQWERVNPTTFAWDRSEVGGKVTLQRLVRVVEPKTDQKRQQAYYVLTAYDFRNTDNTLTMGGGQDEALNGKLAAIYETIETALSDRKKAFLKRLLPTE